MSHPNEKPNAVYLYTKPISKGAFTAAWAVIAYSFYLLFVSPDPELAAPAFSLGLQVFFTSTGAIFARIWRENMAQSTCMSASGLVEVLCTIWCLFIGCGVLVQYSEFTSLMIHIRGNS